MIGLRKLIVIYLICLSKKKDIMIMFKSEKDAKEVMNVLRKLKWISG